MHRGMLKWATALLAVLLALVVVVAGCAQKAPAPAGQTPAPQATVINWKFQAFMPPIKVYDMNVLAFADAVKRMSNGRLVLTPYPEGSLVPAVEMLSALKAGTLDMGLIAPFYHTGVQPVFVLTYGYPGIYRSFEDSVIHREKFGLSEVLRRAYAAEGVHWIEPDPPEPGVILVSRVPINTAADFKGKKIRATGGIAEVFKELGASVVFTAGAELYTAFSTGVVDAVVYGGAKTALDDMKFGEIAKYVIQPQPMAAHGPLAYVVNQKQWDALPDDLKGILDKAVGSVQGSWFAETKYNDLAALNAWLGKGGQAITFSDKDFAEYGLAARRALDRLAAEKNNAFLNEGYDTLKNYMKWRGSWQ